METDLKVSKLSNPNKFGFFTIVFLLVLLAASFMFYRSTKMGPAATPGTPITQKILEDQYGLRVNLIAVTAAGGMVDLRLKMVDAEKARALLEDKNNFPALHISRTNVTLNPSEDAKSQEIQFEDGGSLFLLYSNQDNIVHPGDAVTVLFGKTALEPIQVK